MLEENGGEVRLEKGRLERMGVSPGWCGSVDRALACEPKGRWFDSQSGHMQESMSECVNKWNSKSMFLSLSLPTLLKSIKINVFKKPV